MDFQVSSYSRELLVKNNHYVSSSEEALKFEQLCLAFRSLQSQQAQVPICSTKISLPGDAAVLYFIPSPSCLSDCTSHTAISSLLHELHYRGAFRRAEQTWVMPFWRSLGEKADEPQSSSFHSASPGWHWLCLPLAEINWTSLAASCPRKMGIFKIISGCALLWVSRRGRNNNTDFLEASVQSFTDQVAKLPETSTELDWNVVSSYLGPKESGEWKDKVLLRKQKM